MLRYTQTANHVIYLQLYVQACLEKKNHIHESVRRQLGGKYGHIRSSFTVIDEVTVMISFVKFLTVKYLQINCCFQFRYLSAF